MRKGRPQLKLPGSARHKGRSKRQRDLTDFTFTEDVDMPEPETKVPQSSWADEIEEGDTELPPTSERIVGDIKIVTAWAYNDDGKKVKHVRTYKVEKKLVSKAVARRKALSKFGLSAGDRPGPNPATTVVAEEVLMQVCRGCRVQWRQASIGTCPSGLI